MSEMRINYIREMKRNFLTVEPEGEAGSEYEARMLADNQISGLLRMKIKYEDGFALYCYDITSRQPLGRLLETHSITKNEIGRFLIQLHDTLNAMDSYLLRESGILLEPDYIYVEPELFQMGLCFVPGFACDFHSKLSQLFQYFLKHVDHRDRECVVLAYGLYQESLKENYGIDDLMGLLSGEKKGAVQRTAAGSDENGALSPDMWGSPEQHRPPEQRRPSEQRGPAEQRSPEASDRHKTEPDKEEEREKDLEADAEKGRTAHFLLKQLLLWAAVSLVFPAAICILWGRERLLELRYLLAAAAGGLLLLLVVFDVITMLVRGIRQRKTAEKEIGEQENPWRILYEGKEEEEEDAFASGVLLREASAGVLSGAVAESNAAVSASTPPEAFQTVLLSDCQGMGELHRLESISPDTDDIPILYFPFVIGKHKGLADYVISKDTVSRFHIRCDKNGDKCTITDLNSTNGTRVKGRLLDANETVEVEPGDEVMIAEIGYIWR